MDCKYHRGKKAVGQCKLCGANLCQKCTDFQQQYGRCPACAKDYLQYVYKNFKRGLRYNIFGVVCAVAFLALYIVCICTNNADKSFVILSSDFSSNSNLESFARCFTSSFDTLILSPPFKH